MGRFSEFAQTLERKIRSEIEAELHLDKDSETAVSRGENLNFTSSFSREFDNSPRGMAWLLGKTPKSTVLDPRGRTAYGVKERPLPPHKLNIFQTAALGFFQKMGQDLPPRFSAKELKSAFRRLAMRCHPDHGGTTQNFLDLQESFKILNEIFSKT